MSSNDGHYPEFASFNLITTWLEDCLKNHALCRSKASPPLPIRVIDVLSRDEPFLKESNGACGDYLALTYCWGRLRDMNMMTFGPNSKGKSGLLDPEINVDLHKNGIPFSSMPKSIQDAVTLCRRLGFKYIWIDALCIVQGDEEEWKRESPKMADVYANARLTIAADSADGVEKGFLDMHAFATPYKELFFQRRPIHIRKRIFPEEHVRAPERTCPSSITWNEPLNSRAWALAEVIFSNRCLHYTSLEMVWECNEVRYCECGHSQDLQENDEDSFRIFRNMTLAERSSKLAMYRKWDTVVQQFTRRQINNHPGRTDRDSQRLLALSRVARRFSDILRDVFHLEDEYVAGIWKGDLVRSLLWSIEKGFQLDHRNIHVQWRRPEIPRAPTWSWAAIEGPVFFEPLRNFIHDLQIKEVSVRHSDESDKFGQVISGKLVVHGPVVHGLDVLLEEHLTTDRYGAHKCKVSGFGFRESSLFIFDVPLTQTELNQEFSCLYLGKGEGEEHVVTESRTYNRILLLRSVAGATNTFERAGISSVYTSDDVLDGFLETARLEWITIV